MVLSAKEKLLILATGKATLKEINELEKQAEGENNVSKDGANKETDQAINEGKKEVDENDDAPADQPGESKKDDVSDQAPVEDEKDKKIAELEAQIKEMQKDNVNEDNSGSVIDTDTALLNIFKDFK